MDYTWLIPRSGVIDSDHPDHADLIEADEIERWIAHGAPPPDGFDRHGARLHPDAPESPPLPKPPQSTEVPAVALALSREQAAATLSMSLDTFERHVLPDIRVVTKGRRVLVPVRELERWMERHAARALKD